MKTEIIIEMSTLKIYRLSPDTNKAIPAEYFNCLDNEIENLKKSNSSFSSEVYKSNTNEYERVIIFKK